MSEEITVAACAALICGLGIWERFRLRRSLSRIPIRIHVNGTRGKSSVTRLIAAALREAGLRTNVIEQRDIAHRAAAEEAEALVVECMALQPQLQSLCESKLVCATHAVVTNCRADHLDVMGPTEADVAGALANITPANGKLFTAEQKHLGVLQAAVLDRNCELNAVSAEEVEAVSDLEMAGFRYEENKQNVALATGRDCWIHPPRCSRLPRSCASCWSSPPRASCKSSNLSRTLR